MSCNTVYPYIAIKTLNNNHLILGAFEIYPLSFPTFPYMPLLLALNI